MAGCRLAALWESIAAWQKQRAEGRAAPSCAKAARRFRGSARSDGGLLDRGFIDTNDRSLRWIIKEKVSREVSMIKTQGLGFS